MFDVLSLQVLKNAKETTCSPAIQLAVRTVQDSIKEGDAMLMQVADIRDADAKQSDS